MKKAVVIIISVIVLVGLAIGGFFLFNNLTRKDSMPSIEVANVNSNVNRNLSLDSDMQVSNVATGGNANANANSNTAFGNAGAPVGNMNQNGTGPENINIEAEQQKQQPISEEELRSSLGQERYQDNSGGSYTPPPRASSGTDLPAGAVPPDQAGHHDGPVEPQAHVIEDGDLTKTAQYGKYIIPEGTDPNTIKSLKDIYDEKHGKA